MGDAPQQRQSPDLRSSLAIGLGIGSALGITKVVEKALAPQVGEWGAFAVGVVAAAVGAGVVGLVVYALVRRK